MDVSQGPAADAGVTYPLEHPGTPPARFREL